MTTITENWLSGPQRHRLVQATRRTAQAISDAMGPIELQDWSDEDLVALGEKLLDINGFIVERTQ